MRGALAKVRELAPMLASGRAEIIDRATDEIAALLSAVPVEALAQVEVSMRAGAWRPAEGPYGRAWNTLAPRELREELAARPDLYLGILSMHGNGYVREEAVRRLSRIADGRELPFLLIRLNDWVKPVRDAARHAVQQRLKTPAYAEHFIRSLPLVLRLREAGRDNHAPLLSAIYLYLSRSSARAALLLALHSRSASLSRAAFRILAAGDVEGLAEAAATASDAVVRRAALRLGGPALAERLLRDSAGSVRAEALRLWNREEAWREALLDRSAGVRSAARFYLRDKVDAAQVYREALSSHSNAALAAAIAGAGETGSRADAASLVPYLAHPSPRVRRAAVHALMRLGGSDFVEEAAAMLGDESSAVVGEAARALRPHVHMVGGERLWAMFEPARTPRLLSLIAALPKWESIAYLLRATADEASLEQAVNEVIRWNARYNASSAPPSRAQLARAAAALDAARLPERLRDELRFVIGSF